MKTKDLDIKDPSSKSSAVGRFLIKFYGLRNPSRFQDLTRRIVIRLEGGEAYSHTLRKIFSTYHHLDVGMYTMGGCFVHNNFTHRPPGTKIGRYCEIAYNMAAFNANHPMNLKSQHAFFFNPAFGYTKKDLLRRTRLEIGNDVWIGHNAVIMPGVASIGNGAVIGANTVVHQNVPPYAVVSGFPGRILRYRFDDETIERLEAEKWWEKPIEELRQDISAFQKPLDGTDAIR